MMRCDRRGVRGAEVWAALPTDADASRYPVWWFVLGVPGCGPGGREFEYGEVIPCSTLPTGSVDTNPCPDGKFCTSCKCANRTCSQHKCVKCESTPSGGNDIGQIANV